MEALALSPGVSDQYAFSRIWRELLCRALFAHSLTTSIVAGDKIWVVFEALQANSSILKI